MDIILPRDLTCSQCVLQMTQYAGEIIALGSRM